MVLTDIEQQFLARQHLARLTTIGADGFPQVKPLGFTYNSELGTIDVTGFNMVESAKYRNIQTNPKVALVADEMTEPSMSGVRFLEIRGLAENAVGSHDLQGHLDREIIRIRPRRIVSFNIDPSRPGFASRTIPVGADDAAMKPA
jgi:pyridoxamine 5'-phosphate oxidase family protein